MVKSSSKREERKSRLRAEILSAAGRLFAVHGFEVVTLRAIAEEIGYSHAAIYQYFPDKSHLLSEICRDTFARLIEDFDSITSLYPDPKERLFQASRGMVDFFLKHPQHVRVVFFGPDDRNGVRAGEYISEIGKPLFDRFNKVFQECMNEGDIDSSDSLLSSHAWWCSLLGLAMVLIIQGGRIAFSPTSSLVERTISALWHGLKTPSAE